MGDDQAVVGDADVGDAVDDRDVGRGVLAQHRPDRGADQRGVDVARPDETEVVALEGESDDFAPDDAEPDVGDVNGGHLFVDPFGVVSGVVVRGSSSGAP